MKTSFEVIDFFKTSAGDIIIVKLPNVNSTITHGAILRNDSGSKWKITGIGNGKKPGLKDSKDDDLLIVDFRIERIYGENILMTGDLLYLD